MVQGVETVVVVHGRMLRDADDAVLVRGSACPSDASDSLAVSEGVGGLRTRLRSGTAAASALLDACHRRPAEGPLHRPPCRQGPDGGSGEGRYAGNVPSVGIVPTGGRADGVWQGTLRAWR